MLRVPRASFAWNVIREEKKLNWMKSRRVANPSDEAVKDTFILLGMPSKNGKIHNVD